MKKEPTYSDDFIEMIMILGNQIFMDNAIYGYCPWDYAEEFELNLKEQGFMKK